MLEVNVHHRAGDFALDVGVSAGDQNLRVRMTRKSAEELGMAPGVKAYALIKSVAIVRRALARS